MAEPDVAGAGAIAAYSYVVAHDLLLGPRTLT